MKGMSLYFLIFLAILCAGLMVVTTVSGEPESPRGEGGVYTMNEDWEVETGDQVDRENKTIYMNGNILVEGALHLSNVSVLFNCSYNGEYGIEVMPGGELIIAAGSRIITLTEKHYTFTVLSDYGSHGHLTLTESFISGCGYPSTIPENTGLYIESSDVHISNSTISDNNIGLRFHGVGTHIELKDTMFMGNQDAVFMDSSSMIHLHDDVFLDNVRGVVSSHSYTIQIYDNVFEKNLYGIQMDNSTESEVIQNRFYNNIRAGMSIEYSQDITILENQVESTQDLHGDLGTGLKLSKTTGTMVKSNVFRYNDLGVMILHNNSAIEVADLHIQGGKLGIFVYDENLPGTYTDLKITETHEAAFNANHCSNQQFHHVVISSNDRYTLNVTSSHIIFMQPEFDYLFNLVDEKSTIQLSQTIRIHTLELSGFPLSGTDVRVIDNGETIYATELYDGTDTKTDLQGYTQEIPFTYATLINGHTESNEIRFSVRWKTHEHHRTYHGETQEIIRFYFRIPDLTIANTDIILSPAEPVYNELLTISTTITNLGNEDIQTVISLYRIPGYWQENLHVEMGEITLPRTAELIDEVDVVVRDNRKRIVEFQWVPNKEGDQTLLVLLDESMQELELRKDNNAALVHFFVGPQYLEPVEHAEISLDIPLSLNNSKISSNPMVFALTLKNEGTIKGTVILRVTIFQNGVTLLFFNDFYTIRPGNDQEVLVEVNVMPGDAIVNFTLLPYAGEKALSILTPYLSLLLFVQDNPDFDKSDENDELIPGVVLYSSTAGAIAFCLAYVTFAESARYRFLLLLVPLYMRMSKKDILVHMERGKILGYIEQNPGESYNNIKRDLNMSNGKLAYHISVLEKGGFIKSITDGMYRRFYPRKMKVTTYGRITLVQEQILRSIEETPGISQKDLSKIVDLSTATINYHIRKLTDKGLITSKRTGIFVHYYLNGLTVDDIMRNAIPQAQSSTFNE